jgi:hypothetical protein
LGSRADGGHLAGRLVRWVHNTFAQATGFGITRNIIDCYAALIQLWEPGDRIFLFGFSRGAYTVRCLSGVIARCGIPIHPKNEPTVPLKLDRASTQAFASYAVKHIYQFTYPRKLADATPYQRSLLDTREKLAARFRLEFGSSDANDPAKANVYPYFIGVFDTVAALGNPVTTVLFTSAFLLFAAGVGLVGRLISLLNNDTVIGCLLGLLTFHRVFLATIIMAGLVALAVYVFTHLKFDFFVPGNDLSQSLRTIHFNEPWMQFYDYDLNPNVSYARHAISIDENRKNFNRVKWFSTKDTERDGHGIQWFEQVWCAGNHSDIGGGYPENEARLSDITLEWMLKWACAVPCGLSFDVRVLKLFPYPDGMQHDEVKSGFGLITRYFGWSWPRGNRRLPAANAIIHRTVYERFDLDAVQIYDERSRYWPTTLSTHNDFVAFYKPGAPFPAQSFKSQTAMADEPPPVQGR